MNTPLQVLLLLLLSCQVVSDSLQPHGLQHARLSCPLLSLEVWSNSCTLSQWCHSTVSSSVASFLCLQSFPASGSFPMSQLFTSASQSIGASVLPMNIEGWFPLGWTGSVSWQSKDSQESSPTPQFNSMHSLALSLLYGPAVIAVYDYWNNHNFNYTDLCWQSNVSAF